MKKLLASIAAVAALTTLLTFVGCADNGKPHGSGNVTLDVRSAVFTADGGFTELTDKTSVKDYMDKLAENGELVFGGSYGDYGFYLQTVYGKEADENHFWAVYTDLVKIGEDSTVYSNAEYGTFSYGEKTLYSAVYGVSFLPCVDGYTYAFVYTSV